MEKLVDDDGVSDTDLTKVGSCPVVTFPKMFKLEIEHTFESPYAYKDGWNSCSTMDNPNK